MGVDAFFLEGADCGKLRGLFPNVSCLFSKRRRPIDGRLHVLLHLSVTAMCATPFNVQSCVGFEQLGKQG